MFLKHSIANLIFNTTYLEYHCSLEVTGCTAVDLSTCVNESGTFSALSLHYDIIWLRFAFYGHTIGVEPPSTRNTHSRGGPLTLGLSCSRAKSCF